MLRWWCVLVLVLVVTVEAGVDGQDSVWPISEAFKLEIQDWFANPTKRALNGLPRLLLQDDNGVQEKAASDTLGVYLPSTDPDIVDNEQCRKDVAAFLRLLNNKRLLQLVSLIDDGWPYRLPDSWGKLPDGILYGNIRPWGVMEECTRITVNTTIKPPVTSPMFEAQFRGRYCLVSYNSQANEDKATREVNRMLESMSRMGATLLIPNTTYASYGTCIPSSCTHKDLEASIKALRTEMADLYVDCHLKNEVKPLYAGDIVYIVFLGIIASLLLLATIADLSINYFDNQHYRKGPLKYLLVFSAYTNLCKIFHINTKENPEVISCLHGIRNSYTALSFLPTRVMSMIWVVWGHEYLFSSINSINLNGIQQLTDNLLEQTITGGVFAVDTFFLLSGLLVMYGLMKEYKRVKRINWSLYYLHRVISNAGDEPRPMIDTYSKPWCRAAPYLVGFWGGLLLDHYRHKKLNLTWWQVLLGWALAITVGMLVVFGMADYNTLVDPKLLTQDVSIPYESLSRGAWALAVLWVIFACHKGYAGPINTFLSHPCWQPLSRLTFSIYLTSLSIQLLFTGVSVTPFYTNHLNVFIQTTGILFIGGIAAVIISLIAEGPVLGLEKLLLRRPGRGELQKSLRRKLHPETHQSETHQSETHQSETHQSETHQSDTHQPDTHQPESHQSETHQPESHQSETHQSDTHQPDTHQPESHQSETHQSDTHQPDTHQSETHQSESHQSETHQSETHQSETHQPETHQSETHQPETHQPEIHISLKYTPA
ncbi:hypothetical protein Pmani_007687 [Petrolisthes manimaculis]|uniref:Nose resistant-to-fluoxetine protein N-terminal domain-containing protein n=1 Tax=Petrolisthes manimaculis TaxID=1843537 RepID=A0AAE1Q888_9EUCA|nr:hypothetical protein Pmani_007687 [Petrolisthes manimaculis]